MLFNFIITIDVFRMIWVWFVMVTAGPRVVEGYFADWSLLARDREPTCVDIPENMTLCRNIGKGRRKKIIKPEESLP